MMKASWISFACLTPSATTAYCSNLPKFFVKLRPWTTLNGAQLSFHRSTGRRHLHYSQQQTEEERKMTIDAKEICLAAIAAVDPYQAVRRHFRPYASGLRLITTDRSVPHSFQSPASNEKEYTNDEENDNKNSIFYNLREDYDDVVVVAFGKASSAMARAVVEQLESGAKTTAASTSSSLSSTSTTNNPSRLPNIICGVVVVKDKHGSSEEINYLRQHSIEVRPASHPMPDDRSVAAAKEIMHLVQSKASPRTLVICCISGGGSSLFCLPHPSLSLDDLKSTNKVLLGSGFGINDINVVRKRLDQVKGGRLAIACYPSTIVTLVLSDVLGDPLDLIASGPTVPDTSTWQDAWKLLSRHPTTLQQLPKSVVSLLQQGARDQKGKYNSNSDDTSVHPVFQNPKCQTVVVGNNEIAVNAAAQAAKDRGYNPVVLGTRVEGEARYVANVYTAMAHYLSTHLPRNVDPSATDDSNATFTTVSSLPAALIAGGETTVTLTSENSGKGGRNQELALAAALQMQTLGLRNVVLASVGTDGTDGPTDAAGAVVDGGTVGRLDSQQQQQSNNSTSVPLGNTSPPNSGYEALTRHDAYTYLQQTDREGCSPLIYTGATGTNVADICVTLIR